MTLAIFDLDNTLISGDSDHAWGEFLVDKGLVDGPSYKTRNDAFYEDYKAGKLDIHAYQEFALEPLTQFTPDELEGLHREFMACKIAPMRLPKADRLVRKHRQQGDTLVIITSTNYFVTRPIADIMGIEHLLATEGEITPRGRYTGKLKGIPCYREGKVERLKSWMCQHGQDLSGSYFYSDSQNDLPLLRLVSFPVAVDPDPILAAEAEKREWPIISLRK
jgi:HAD superfamily hydrolase (TIGR01490 family)